MIEEIKKVEEQWIKEQLELKKKLILKNELSFNPETLENLKRIGGVDISFFKEDPNKAVASLIVLDYPSFNIIYEDNEIVPLTLPYIAGFLAFREVPAIEKLYKKLVEKDKENEESKLPQVIFVDGNGYLHPRQFGFACHLGVILDIPTIGVGKNFLVIEDGVEMSMSYVKNKWKTETLPQHKDRQPLIGKSKTLYGYAIKSNETTTNPIFVSIGHKIDINTAIKIVLKTCVKRVPEPIRQADLRSRKCVREILKSHK
ncbi:endonuclease V [Piromyces finnis]|uniref:Endonuclease V n=1 Tax=Piromyces finnis TaxID=1754191 RepID=A0A1Y1VA39_9FUNG|nr:endonuclease V [Piromyces finnis]|eukprot:ORX50793.1 endonuclease V [Piromyces finnis]